MMFFILICCNSPQSQAIRYVKEWQGKKIQIPQNIIWKFNGKDTSCYNLLNSSFKILVYVDSVGCTPCKLKVDRWKSLIDSCQQSFLDVSFLFVLHAHDFEEIEMEFLLHDFNYPVIYDPQNYFDRLNHFPQNQLFQVFLLDGENEVLLIGSPITSTQIWELYKKRILFHNVEL